MFEKAQNSLATKIIIFLCVILFLIFGAITAINSRIQSKFLVARLSEAAERTADFVMTGISYPMLNGDQDVIQMEFDHYRALRGMDVIHLLDHEGIIRRSTDRSLLDKKSLAVNLERALAGEHIHGVEWRKREGKLIFSELRPIFNAKNCYACHTAKRKILGALRIALDWGPAMEAVSVSRKQNILVSFFGLACISLLNIIALFKIVIVPIRRLKTGMKKVSSGDFEYILTTKSKDEIGDLTGFFNVMTADLKKLMQKEKELLNMEREKTEEMAVLNENLENEFAERKKVEEDFITQNKFLNNVIESLSHPFYVIDVNNYKILMANAAALGNKSLEGLNCYEALHNRNKKCKEPEHICPLAKVKKDKKPIIVEHIHCTKEGEKQYVEVHTYPIFDNKGDVIQIIEYCLDITERKTAQRALENAYLELKKTQQQLIQSAKMAAMGQLAAGISHELNQPLTGIRGFAQAALLDLTAEHPLRTDLQKIIEQTDRMDGIIKNVRFFARKSEFKLQELDINQPIEDALMLLNEQLKVHNIQVEKSLTSDLPRIQGDSNQLQQVFLNLITNSRDAIDSLNRPEAGRLIIKTALSKDKNNIEIIFQDTGCGISQENMHYIFNPFFTTKSPEGGMGLGLAIVYRIIEAHKGNIEIESKEGQGTKLKISLPIINKISDEKKMSGQI